MKAKSIKGNSPEGIKALLHQSMTDGFKPSLAIVFLSVTQNRNEVCNIFNEADIAVFGSTAEGEFIDGDLEKESTSILLLDVDKESFVVHLEERSGKSK